MSVNQTDILQDLSYLLGESTTPASGTSDYTLRTAFIQRALERIYRIYDFEPSKLIATVTFSNGVGALPTNARTAGPDLDVRVVRSGQNDDLIFTQVPYEEFDQYGAGDYKYWLSPQTNSSYNIVLSDTSQSAATVRYTTLAPTINASVSTPFPSSMVVARGALVYQRLADDPQADTSQDEALFQNELQEVIAAQNRNRPIRRAKDKLSVNDWYTGRVI